MLIIENARGEIVESRHRVSLAVVDSAGSLVARSGNPTLVTFLRSAAKPFQALPLVEDGAIERFAITDRELALACASHNSERHQVELVGAWLGRMGLGEEHLACGPHPSLALDFAVINGPAPQSSRLDLAPPSPLASNCSGKHAGMLALALHHGWNVDRYHRREHPVQQRLKREMARWSGLQESEIGEGVDGCAVVSFAMPLLNMAGAFARLVAGDDPAARQVVAAMSAHPELIAGTGRLCTALMQAYPRRLLAKVGAEGVYGAALPDRALGIAIKVEDGHPKAAMVALVATLEQLGVDPSPRIQLPSAVELPIHNTRRDRVGVIRPAGALTFV